MNRRLISVSVTVGLLLGTAPLSAAVRTALRDTIPPGLAPLGVEHEDLRASFNAALNRAIAPGATLADRDGLINFLRSTLIPHAQVEERVLYPALEDALGTRGFATAALVLDHQAVAQRTLELAMLASNDPVAFQRRALALAGIVERHFGNEEDFVFPNLARKMDARSLRALLARMDTERIVPWSPR